MVARKVGKMEQELNNSLYTVKKFKTKEAKEFMHSMRRMERAIINAMPYAERKAIIDEMKCRLGEYHDPRVEVLEEINESKSRKRRSDLWRHYKKLRRQHG